MAGINFGLLQPAQQIGQPLMGKAPPLPETGGGGQESDGGIGEFLQGAGDLASALKGPSEPSLSTGNLGNTISTQAESVPNPNQQNQPIGPVGQDLMASPAYQQSLQAYQKAQETGISKNPLMTVVDFSRPASEKRMWVVNPQSNEVLMNTYVSEGSGKDGKGGFSNDPNSHQSSLGTYVTGAAYAGSKGTSLRIQGLDKGLNDNAEKRGVVVHGADYVGEGKSGRSWGCFALPKDQAQKYIDLTKGGSVIHAYSGNAATNTNSTGSFINNPQNGMDILKKPENNPFRTNTGTNAAIPVIKQFEGYASKPYWDVNAYRNGYGSDTMTGADGKVRKVTPGTQTNKEDADRDLARRTKEFENTAMNQAGVANWNKLPVSAKAALTSVAYNYGSLPKRILPAVRSGDIQGISEAVRSLGSDNKGVNRQRRSKEAELIVNPGLYQREYGFEEEKQKAGNSSSGGLLRSTMNKQPVEKFDPQGQQPPQMPREQFDGMLRQFDQGRDDYAQNKAPGLLANTSNPNTPPNIRPFQLNKPLRNLSPEEIKALMNWNKGQLGPMLS